MAAVGGEGIFPVSRRSWQPEATGSVPDRGASPLAPSDSPTQPKEPVDLGPLPRATRCPAPRGLHPAPVPASALRRQASEVRTVCVNRASTGLCGGQRVTAVPTATEGGNPGHGQEVTYGRDRTSPTRGWPGGVAGRR